jgi:hypothetical protein
LSPRGSDSIRRRAAEISRGFYCHGFEGEPACRREKKRVSLARNNWYWLVMTEWRGLPLVSHAGGWKGLTLVGRDGAEKTAVGFGHTGLEMVSHAGLEKEYGLRMRRGVSARREF